MKKILFFCGLIFCSCNNPLSHKDIPFNEYLIGTWSIKAPIKFYKSLDGGMTINQLDLEFTEKKVYITITMYSKDIKIGPAGPEAHDYTLDGKRVLINGGNIYAGLYNIGTTEGLFVFQSDSSLKTSPMIDIPGYKDEIPEINLYKK